MSFISVYEGYASPQFLASEVGLRRETRQMPESMAVTSETDRCMKYVKAGTIFPANDGTAEGIVFVDVDVSGGPMPGAVMTAGKVYTDRLPAAPTEEAKTAMSKNGMIFGISPTTTRP